ncbi:hypothetical protein DICVIV_01650 [Dictyocaulus viviparus]|uniref:ELYS beta-propeller domain-containing protein n=1 Tax=Dictyocaulus viviparus TaxID=29172 RepID=A0A0D8Y649_DICVI|nr:hypothetical protein DICVIV_01650 [Dictyocaulus viviparus]
MPFGSIVPSNINKKYVNTHRMSLKNVTTEKIMRDQRSCDHRHFKALHTFFRFLVVELDLIFMSARLLFPPMPSERVPDPLRQKFFLHKCDYELEYSAHICLGKDRDCGVKFLRDCTGEFLNLVALYRANLLVVCRIQEDGVQLCFLFPEELSIKEIEYIRCQGGQLIHTWKNVNNKSILIDGMFGFVVALNSKKISVHPHCVALLHCCNYGLQLVRKLKIDQEIACLKVVADADSMIQLKSLLHSKMASWPHIVVVGTRYAHCFLFHFEQLEPQQGTDVHVPLFGKLTDGLASFHDGDTFIYSSVDSCTGKPQTKRLSRESVYVSCISFMEKSRTVILGFSFGGIMSISLTSCPTIEPLIYPCSAPVQFITPLEPDDDPRAHLWFFVAYAATKTKPVQLCLYEVMFPEEETIPISERKWSKPMFGIKLVIPFHNSSRWVSLQTLIRDRNKIRRADESTRDSFKLGSEKDKSLVFFTFIANDKNGSGLKVSKLFNIQGGVFDLNAYYYKRLVHAIIHDGTAAQQCAFMSIVQPITTNVENEDFLLSKDCIVDTRCITRFISTTNDAEQMFYPSAFEISSRFVAFFGILVFAIYVAGTKKCYHFRLPSLPNQLLSSICADLELHVADARNACTWLAALGFCKKETHKAKNQYKDLSSVLSVLISHQRTRAVLQFIKRCDCSESRHLIATWIWEEIDIASKKLHETIAPLFARFSAPLSPAGRMSFAHVNDVFVAGVQIFRELLRTCKREQDETEEYMTSLEAQRFATENLRSYSAVIRQLMHSKILPVAEDREIRLAMEESLRKRRLRITWYCNDKLVTRMRKRCPSEPFWYAEGPEWYPPALLNLLAPILVLNIPIKWNGQLLAFYLLDYASCKIECDFNSDVAVNLVDLIAKQMHGILCMNKDEIQNVYNMWCDDCGKCVAEELNERSSPCIDNLSAASEVEELMNIPRPLSVAEENKLKGMLPIPPNAEQRKEVKEYLEILPAIKILRNDYVHLSIDRPQWPPKIKEAIEKFEYGKHVNAPSYGSGIPVLNRAKTPIPLPKLCGSCAFFCLVVSYSRSSKLNAKNGWDGTATSMVQHIGTNSTSRTNEYLIKKDL